MDWDDATATMCVACNDCEARLAENHLCIVDLATGQATVIGAIL